MKYVLIAAGLLAVLFIASQVWAKSESKDIETYQYDVLKNYETFEIRKYESANFIYTTLDAKTYEESSGNGFRTLAGYIFGGNSDNQKIAMTAPVEMVMQEKVTMKFMIPAEYQMEDLPDPNDPNVRFVSEPEKTLAAITFGGWANDARIEAYTQKLKTLLEENGITYTGEFSFFGYNSPFEVIGRRNEVVVEVVNFKDE